MGLSRILQVKVPPYSLLVLMEAREIAFHSLQVQMAVLEKVVFHSLERMDFFHIQQAHLGRRIAQDGLLEDSR